MATTARGKYRLRGGVAYADIAYLDVHEMKRDNRLALIRHPTFIEFRARKGPGLLIRAVGTARASVEQ